MNYYIKMVKDNDEVNQPIDIESFNAKKLEY